MPEAVMGLHLVNNKAWFLGDIGENVPGMKQPQGVFHRAGSAGNLAHPGPEITNAAGHACKCSWYYCSRCS